jgi:hypothetical protein
MEYKNKYCFQTFFFSGLLMLFDKEHYVHIISCFYLTVLMLELPFEIFLKIIMIVYGGINM